MGQRNFRRTLGIFFLSILTFIILFLFLTPTLLSTPWGKARVIKSVNGTIPGKASINKLNLSWFGKQRIQGFSLKDPAGKKILCISSVVIDTSLVNLLLKNGSNIAVEGLEAIIHQDENGITNLEQALGITSNRVQDDPTVPYTIQVQNVKANIHTSSSEPFTIELWGSTSTGEQQGTFAIEAILNGFKPNQIKKLSAKVNNVPSVVLDQFIAVKYPQWSGLIQATMGDAIDTIDLHQNQGNDGSDLSLIVDSPLLHATAHGQLSQDQLTLSAPAIINGTFTPALIKLLTRCDVPILQKSTPARLTINQLTVPFNQLEHLALSASLQTDQLNLGIQVAAQMDDKGQFPGFFDVSIQGENITGKASLALDKGISLKPNGAPASFQLKLNPEQFAALRRLLKPSESTEIVLKEPTEIKVEVDQLHVPFHNMHQRWLQGSLSARVEIDHLHVQDPHTGQEIFIQQTNGHLQSQSFNDRIDFALKMKHQDPSLNKNELNLTGYLHEPFTKSGTWNSEGMTLALNLNAVKVPAGLICEIACLEKNARYKFDALFGPLIDATVDVQLQRMNGPLKAYVHGENGNMRLDAGIHQGTLTLNSPFQAEATASPALGDSVLQDLLPILGGMLRADERLRLTITPEGFSFPLQGRALAEAQIGQIKIELGTLYFAADAPLTNLLRTLKADSNVPISVWFTPIYLSQQQGNLHVERFDMLALQKYPLAVWGIVDLLQDQLNMSIGVSARALQLALGLTIPDPNYMMALPLGGKMGQARIDKSKATAKIAALTAQLAGGAQGKVLGTVLGLAAGGNGNIPSPTTLPLPWETAAIPVSEDESSHHRQTSDNPVKTLKKNAGNLLKNIFR